MRNPTALNLLGEWQRRAQYRLSWGFPPMDRLMLQTGLAPGTITAIYGQSCTGKTRLLWRAALSCAITFQGSVAMLHSYPPAVVHSLLERFQRQGLPHLDNIRCYFCSTSLNLIDTLTSLESTLRTNANSTTLDLRLVLIDDPSYLFSSLDHRTLPQIKSAFYQLIREISSQHGVAIVYSHRYNDNPKRSTKVWIQSHFADEEILLSKADSLSTTIVASKLFPKEEDRVNISFEITELEVNTA